MFKKLEETYKGVDELDELDNDIQEEIYGPSSQNK